MRIAGSAQGDYRLPADADLWASEFLAEAFDISKEAPRVRERYGKGLPKNVADGGPRILEQFLLQRGDPVRSPRGALCLFQFRFLTASVELQKLNHLELN